MDIKITPAKLKGEVTIPPSKSVAHRMIIGAALADGRSEVTNLSPSADITATIECMRALGAKIDFSDNKAVIEGITKIPKKAVLNCRESGSTLRFLIPVAAALGVDAEFIGGGKLPTRPLTPFFEEFPKHGVTFELPENGTNLPLKTKGKLNAGRYEIDGGISSQFITGLLFALPLLDGDSEIVLTSPLQSAPYVDITIEALKSYGCDIKSTESGFSVRGNAQFHSCNSRVEGDFSQAAFFYTANCLGSNIKLNDINADSAQGDKLIADICCKFDAARDAFELDCSDVPDLVPILTVLASYGKGTTRLTNVARLRIKECDRLAAMEDCLNRVGGKVKAFEDYIEIEGVGTLHGGEVSAYNDHRIAMSMSIAATISDAPIIIHGAECVAKSYPDFFEVYRSIGGIANEV
ncbi:MAG: 3-phosphoshikimate 1-carboxyvinyltransferase [Oscillospiraceae bacterium]